MALLEQLPRDLVSALGVSGARSLSGGDGANAFRLETGDGPVFAKTMRNPASGVLPLEAAALEKLLPGGAAGEVADMADGSLDDVVVAQILLYLLRLRCGLHDNQSLAACSHVD